ncbi:MAG TPA: alpha/beta hydrolase [Chlamydiales bacterium]|nr:alpha/beta hydrolase [Chlamydiales bacterium]
MFEMPFPQELVWISDREQFWSTENIAQQTYMFAINPINISHFANKKVLLLIHGYNNTTEEAQQSYFAVSKKMGKLIGKDGKSSYDAMIHYFWPGDQKLSAYSNAEKNAKNPMLRDRLALTLSALSHSASCVDVIAHSMGNRVLLEALSHTLERHSPIIRNFYSFAAAVDDDSIETGNEYAIGAALCKSIYVFHSDVDIALHGYNAIEQHEALGSDENIDINKAPKNVQFIDCTLILKGNHSAYFTEDADPIYSYIGNEQKKETIAANPKQWKVLEDGTIKEGDVVLNSLEKWKFLSLAAGKRLTEELQETR